MAVSRAERNQEIERLLAGMTALRGVTAASIVDSDGFVTHIRRDFEVDTDALGAAVQITLSAAQRAAENFGQRETMLVIGENAGGRVLLAPLNRGFVLAVVTDESSMLGAVRYEIRETIPDLNRLFG